jgi:hypothetical protein
MGTKIKKNYWAPTPQKWRKFGDALLGVGLAMTTYTIAGGLDQIIQLTSLFLTIIGKFLTNFFTEDTNP